MRHFFTLSGAIIIIWQTLFSSLSAHETMGSLESGLKEAGSDSLRIEMLLEMGDRFEHTDFNAALHFYNEALKQSEEALGKNRNTSETKILEDLYIKSLRYIALLYKGWGKYDEAMDGYRNLQSIYEESGRHEYTVRALISQANIYYYQGLYPAAISILQKTLPMAKDHQFSRLKADINLNIANFYYLTGDYTQSLEHFHTALEIYNSLELEIHHGSIYVGLGNLFSSLGNFEQSLEHYQKALGYFDELIHHNQLSNVHLSMGSLFYGAGNLEAAREHYYAAKKHAGALSNARMLSQCLTNLGMLYSREQQYEKAFHYYNEALEQAELSNQQHSMCYILRNMALAYTRQGNHTLALQKAQESLEIARNIESVNDQAESYRILSQVYENQGRFLDALQKYKQYKSYNDSLLDVEKQKQLTEMDAVFRHTQQQQQIELQQMDLERNKALLQQKSQQMNMFILIAVLTLVLAIVFIYYNNHKRKTNQIILKQNLTIKENQKSIKNLLQESDNQHKFIQNLEKQSIAFEKKVKEWEMMGASMLSTLMPSGEHIRDLFHEKAYLLPEPEKSNNTFFYRIYENTTTRLVALATSPQKGLPTKLLYLYMASAMEEVLSKTTLVKTETIYLSLADKLHQINANAPKQQTPLPDYKIALLAIGKKDHRVSFTSRQLPLFMAIARNAATAGSKTEYQEIQTFGYSKGAAMVNGNKNTEDVISGNFKLKKQDRLYILLDCLNGNGQSPQKYHERILVFLDNHQEIKAHMQQEKLKDKLNEWKKEEDVTDCPAVWAIEL